jgi:hypothetical protein
MRERRRRREEDEKVGFWSAFVEKIFFLKKFELFEFFKTT